MALTNKQRIFIAEYLRDFNATRAAIAAGYSEKTARAIGCENLTKPDIKEAIDERMMSRDEVIVGLTDIARGNIADLMDVTTAGYSFRLVVEDEGGNKIVNPKTKLIKKIKQKVTTILAKSESGEDREIIETELELYSAHEAYRDLGKYHALFIDRQDIGGDVTLRVIYDKKDANSA